MRFVNEDQNEATPGNNPSNESNESAATDAPKRSAQEIANSTQEDEGDKPAAKVTRREKEVEPSQP